MEFLIITGLSGGGKSQAEHGCAVYRTDMQGSIHLTLNRGD